MAFQDDTPFTQVVSEKKRILNLIELRALSVTPDSVNFMIHNTPSKHELIDADEMSDHKK
jgi:hypothetical protein